MQKRTITLQKINLLFDMFIMQQRVAVELEKKKPFPKPTRFYSYSNAEDTTLVENNDIEEMKADFLSDSSTILFLEDRERFGQAVQHAVTTLIEYYDYEALHKLFGIMASEDSTGFVHYTLARLNLVQGQIEPALNAIEKAIHLHQEETFYECKINILESEESSSHNEIMAVYDEILSFTTTPWHYHYLKYLRHGVRGQHSNSLASLNLAIDALSVYKANAPAIPPNSNSFGSFELYNSDNHQSLLGHYLEDKARVYLILKDKDNACLAIEQAKKHLSHIDPTLLTHCE